MDSHAAAEGKIGVGQGVVRPTLQEGSYVFGIVFCIVVMLLDLTWTSINVSCAEVNGGKFMISPLESDRLTLPRNIALCRRGEPKNMFNLD